jgi:plastocyanin
MLTNQRPAVSDFKTAIFVLACLGTFVAAGCGSSTAPSSDVTITIRATGPSPAEMRVPVGARVSFVNNDTRPHAMSSDPIQTHTDCPPINDVGFLNPGQSRSTGALNVAGTCGFHDHTNELDATFKGRIIVQ